MVWLDRVLQNQQYSIEHLQSSGERWPPRGGRPTISRNTRPSDLLQTPMLVTILGCRLPLTIHGSYLWVYSFLLSILKELVHYANAFSRVLICYPKSCKEKKPCFFTYLCKPIAIHVAFSWTNSSPKNIFIAYFGTVFCIYFSHYICCYKRISAPVVLHFFYSHTVFTMVLNKLFYFIDYQNT